MYYYYRLFTLWMIVTNIKQTFFLNNIVQNHIATCKVIILDLFPVYFLSSQHQQQHWQYNYKYKQHCSTTTTSTSSRLTYPPPKSLLRKLPLDFSLFSASAINSLARFSFGSSAILFKPSTASINWKKLGAVSKLPENLENY